MNTVMYWTNFLVKFFMKVFCLMVYFCLSKLIDIALQRHRSLGNDAEVRRVETLSAQVVTQFDLGQRSKTVGLREFDDFLLRRVEPARTEAAGLARWFQALIRGTQVIKSPL